MCGTALQNRNLEIDGIETIDGLILTLTAQKVDTSPK
jgi:hypothetical protein